MKLKVITRNYYLEWIVVLLVSLGYCGYFVYSYLKTPEIIDDKPASAGLAIFVSLFVLSFLGLLLGWKKKEAVDLEGWKYKLYRRNKSLFLLYTGGIDSLSFVLLSLILGYCSGWFDFTHLHKEDYWLLGLFFILSIIFFSLVNYRKYRLIDNTED